MHPLLALLFGLVPAQTRTVELARTTPAGRAVCTIVPTVGPGLRVPETSKGSASNAAAAVWQAMSVPPGIYLRAISMGTPLVGYAAGELGVVLKSVDGGSTWTTIQNVGFPYYWYGCHAFDANTVVVSGFQNQSG